MIKSCIVCQNPFDALRFAKVCSAECRAIRRKITIERYMKENWAHHRMVCDDWRRRNPDFMPAYKRKWREENRERNREYDRRAAKRNREKFNAKNRRRRAIKLANGGIHTAEQIKAMLVAQKYQCANLCGQSLKKKYDVDHVVPIALGGSNDISNIQILCPTCNRKKAGKLPEFWARENGRLV